MNTLTLSLISHTNVGKTTLARTLLKKDVGEIADRPHVTDSSEAHGLLTNERGERLLLWDTPGFGDTARLLKRLRHADNPFGWFLTQVYDRFADRPFWCSQQAIRNVKEEADVVLYLVNATEEPEAAPFLEMEMDILAWTQKPVVVLLNQTGTESDEAEIHRWHKHFESREAVSAVLSLDAFARCWIHEDNLMRTVADCAPKSKRRLAKSLADSWREANRLTFEQSIHILTRQLLETAGDSVSLERPSWSERVRHLMVSGWPGRGDSPKELAMAELASRLDQRIRSSLGELIALHGLDGETADVILERMRENYASKDPVDEGVAAALGGFVTGALGGLTADLAAGGLSFGGGAVVGGLLGAAGAGTLAKGFNIIKNQDQPSVQWDRNFLDRLTQSAILRYLAVAHYGRGRGPWRHSEAPPEWKNLVEVSLAPHKEQLEEIWRNTRNRKTRSTDSKLAQTLSHTILLILEKLHDTPQNATK